MKDKEVISNVMRDTTYLYYVDETASSDNEWKIYTALGIPSHSWNEAFSLVKRFRAWLSNEYGIQLYKELHATKFVNGQ